jgi:hypothetical protein
LGITVNRILLKKDPAHRWLFWWSIDGRKWYPINSRNVQPKPNGDKTDPFEAFRLYREALNRVLSGYTETFMGEYDRAKGVLKVKALAEALQIHVGRPIK